MTTTDRTASTIEQAPPEQTRGTPVIRALLGVAVLVGIVTLATMALNEGDPAEYQEMFPTDFVGPMWLTLSGEDQTYDVEVSWGRLSTTFEHQGAEEQTYYFDRGTALYGRAGALEVTVTPAADVTFGFGPEPPGGINIGATPWEVAPEEGVGPNEPAADGETEAYAEVNEYTTYGLLVEGVSLWTEPHYEAEQVTTVRHGDRLKALCWTESVEVTQSNWSDPSDDAAEHTSRVWFLVETPEGNGYIADAWFSRSDGQGRLNLSECPSDAT